MEVKEHRIANMGLRQFCHSALTDSIDVPTHREEEEISSSISVTYVPARTKLQYLNSFYEDFRKNLQTDMIL